MVAVLSGLLGGVLERGVGKERLRCGTSRLMARSAKKGGALPSTEAGIRAVEGEQFNVGSGFDNPSVREDEDGICVADGGAASE